MSTKHQEQEEVKLRSLAQSRSSYAVSGLRGCITVARKNSEDLYIVSASETARMALGSGRVDLQGADFLALFSKVHHVALKEMFDKAVATRMDQRTIFVEVESSQAYVSLSCSMAAADLVYFLIQENHIQSGTVQLSNDGFILATDAKMRRILGVGDASHGASLEAFLHPTGTARLSYQESGVMLANLHGERASPAAVHVKRTSRHDVLAATVTQLPTNMCLRLLVDADTGTVKHASPLIKSLFGYSVEEIVGQNVGILSASSELIIQEGVHVLRGLHRDGTQFFGSVEMSQAPNSRDVSVTFRRVDPSGHKAALFEANTYERALPVLSQWYVLSHQAIGRGFCGDVHLGLHRLTGAEVAVKCVPKALLLKSGLRMPPDEITSLTRLKYHRHIERLYEWRETETEFFVLTEYASGGELLDYVIDSGRLQPAEALFFFRQICEGVAFMHANGIAHRDLKLENMLLDAHGNVKIIDLGFSEPFQDEFGEPILTSSFCGTEAYCAPELFLGRPFCSSQADVWALGVCLYMLVTGYTPFPTPNRTIVTRWSWPAGIECKDEVVVTLLESIFRVLEHRASLERVLEILDMPMPSKVDGAPIDEDIIARLEAKGLPADRVREAVRNEENGQLAAAYYMMHTSKLNAKMPQFISKQAPKCTVQ